MAEEEKLAEEYADKIINHKMAVHDIFEKEKVECELKQAFLAGLKAKTQWHDLRKNPDDLPEDCSTVLAIDNLDDKEISMYEFICSNQWEWLPRRIAVLSNEQIIAWCEIPTFED